MRRLLLKRAFSRSSLDSGKEGGSIRMNSRYVRSESLSPSLLWSWWIVVVGVLVVVAVVEGVGVRVVVSGGDPAVGEVWLTVLVPVVVLVAVALVAAASVLVALVVVVVVSFVVVATEDEVILIPSSSSIRCFCFFHTFFVFLFALPERDFPLTLSMKFCKLF